MNSAREIIIINTWDFDSQQSGLMMQNKGMRMNQDRWKMLRSILAEELNCTEDTICDSTRIDAIALGSSIHVFKLFSNLRKKGYVLDDIRGISTVAELKERMNKKPLVLDDIKFDSSDDMLGIDIQAVSELPETQDYREHPFYMECFTPKEISYCLLKKNPREHFAGRYACKEALIKIDNSLLATSLNEIEILPDPVGKPCYPGYMLSISHSGGMAVAVAMRKAEVKNKTPYLDICSAVFLGCAALFSFIVILYYFAGNVSASLKPESRKIAESEPVTPASLMRMNQYEKQFENSIGMSFILVNPGTFQMGSSSHSRDESPMHDVTITRPYYLATTEVTQGQWKRIMGADTWKDCPEYQKYQNRYPVDSGENYPVVYVNYVEIHEFLKQLSLREGRNYSLPTEAQWEYAARAGTETDFSFGDDTQQLQLYGWYVLNAYELGNQHPDFGINPVASKLPNPWGFYDIHGNVYEWVKDWYSPDYYKVSPQFDPKGPESGRFRVRRSGCWYNGLAENMRSASRGYEFPDSRTAFLGFRVAMNLD
jgi:phosphopantetheine--protein transferase-like protein